MAKVKMLRQPKGQFNSKPFPEAGEVFETSDEHAAALVMFKYAKHVDGDEKPTDEKPDTADERETATDPNADERETREVSAKAIRTWANDNDIDVPARGAIPAEVREKFNAAHADN